VTANSIYNYQIRLVLSGSNLISPPSNTVTVTTPIDPSATPNTTPTPAPTPTLTRHQLRRQHRLRLQYRRNACSDANTDAVSAADAVAEFIVAPNGAATNDGTRERPYDLPTVLSTTGPARPGDAIWLRGGTYSLPNAKLSNTDAPPFISSLTGTSSAPIMLRQQPGERATIEGGIRVEGAWTYYMDFEVTNPNLIELSFVDRDEVYGNHVKLINLVIHDCGGDGIGFWQSADGFPKFTASSPSKWAGTPDGFSAATDMVLLANRLLCRRRNRG